MDEKEFKEARKFSDGTIWDNSIDWDDDPTGRDGGYDRHANYIIPAAMMELVELRTILAERDARIAELEQKLYGLSKNSAFYKCCALSGEVPAEGSEPYKETK